VDRLDDQLAAIVGDGLPGAVVFAAGPGFEAEGAAGLANVATGEPMTVDHRFQIGSVMKTFAATIVLQLVDEGALDLDGDSGIVEGVTVRQLLNHTSGLPDFFDDIVALFEPYREDPTYRWRLSPHEMLALDKERSRLFAPGTGWSYRGSNYLALGLLVEEKTGSSLRDELQRRVAGPLGLDATELLERGRAPAGLARGYFPADNPLLPGPGPGPVDGTDLDTPFNWAGGGLASTARDVARFLEALLAGDLLPAQLRAEMLTTVPSDWDETDAYGLGIAEISSLMRKADSPCGSAWGHIGFSTGYTTIALASETGDRRVVFMANGFVMSDEGWQALGRVVWPAYCG
jgi:D-alanyl-D-alanine carboxypeptidase